jgi:2-C-methyl-D-erythritol 4-phosphate cytidylyltransferase
LAGFADAIVLAAGGSQRTNGFDKLHAVILDRPLVAWTLAAVAAAESVRKIVLVVRAEQVATIQQAYWVIEAGATVVAGGERRQESVAAGVEATDADIVLIHDGARPLATSALVDAVAAATLQAGCAVPLVPLAESLRRLRRTSIVDWIDRYGLHTAQTPQGVQRKLLLEAYAQHDPWGPESIIDETLLVQMGGAAVAAVRGERANLKVTLAEDVEIVSAVLTARAAVAGVRASVSD